MIKYSIISASVEELTILPILVQIDTLRLAIAIWHHLTQRRILDSEILTRIGAIASNATLDFRIIKTLFSCHVKKQRVLTQLNHRTPVNALIVATTALRVYKAKFIHVIGTLWIAIHVHRPITHLLIRSILKAGLAENHLVFTTAAEVIRTAIERIRIKAGCVCRTLQRAV